MQYIIDLKTKIVRIINVGLGYLHLDRQTMTLSGGEKRRIKLAAALQSQLTGVIYIFDEPTIGLHPKNTDSIIKVLKELRNQENTVIIIEHDLDVIKNADYIIDMGPGAGKQGGEIIACGSYQELLKNKNSTIGQYLIKEKKIKNNFRINNKYFIIENACIHNLRNINVFFHINCLNVVTGVSGSGKSTLVFEVLAKQRYSWFDEIIVIKQGTITTTKRSNIATYTGIYDEIRKLFGNLKEAQQEGFSSKYFSFNNKGGRCENCQGLGTITSNMLFFQDIEVVCPVCKGKRFIPEILALKYREASIDDILHLSVIEVTTFFFDNHKIIKILKILKDVGLGYLELGQVLTTLSGGEKQRLKLAVTLLTNINKHNLYLIDEPTTGLHPYDIEHLLVLFNRIIDSGSTIVIVEHNQQIINEADWIVDLGPGGGNDGGQVIAIGTPLEIKNNHNSLTGRYL